MQADQAGTRREDRRWNVAKPALQEQVQALVDKAMAGFRTAMYPSTDAAAKAWSQVAQPLTNRHQVETGAKLCALPGGRHIRIAGSVASAEDCTTSRQCGIHLVDAPEIPGTTLLGYVHCHPYGDTFSENDLYFSLFLVRSRRLQKVLAYVSSPSGRLLKWSTESVRRTPQKSWQDYIKKTVEEVR